MNSFSIPHLYVTGTNYEIGFKTGQEFKSRINKYLKDFEAFQSDILPFIRSAYGKNILDSYFNIIRETFPWYAEEIKKTFQKGISDGSEIVFDWILALNLRVEILHLATTNEFNMITRKQDSAIGCSDFFLIDDKNSFLVHNEDTDPSVYETCYILTAKVISANYNGRPSPEEEFTSYCYAGHLPGNAFSFNKSGFSFGVNALYPKQLILNRQPRQIISRLMLSSKNLAEFEEIILHNTVSYALSVNLGFFGSNLNLLNSTWKNINCYFHENESDHQTENSTNAKILATMFNYEISSNEMSNNFNKVSKHCIIKENPMCKNDPFYSQKYYYHLNSFDRIKDEQVSSKIESSIHRRIRLKVIKPPNNLKDLLDIASDAVDIEFPIFRTPRTTDGAMTVATVFDLNEKQCSIFLCKPCNDYKPLLKIKME